ncbi:TetR family transcriptional regulator [Sphingomonas sp. HITSZ_GF]|uniref:TetR/AcrR family transcriptional regulator n=1 Tax=Sphingomonas sp. HITSZ_GF TaxID=3037247 RepID=UPI00240E5BA7|nr:TetR/AcrR family transcriptional regulator [Sphingomonas sp. HITSZ_GF]MDG2535570.1 TetR family transcriptional regulator [Sphingomonas sp. HITSZ_GF]
MIPPVPSRHRNAIATRQAILASARRHFARENYENVGLREIAGHAGVDPALVSRYFGSKEALFLEAVRGEDKDIMDGATPGAVAEHFAQLFLDKGDKPAEERETHLQRFLILLHSAASPKAGQIIRETIDTDILRPVAQELGGEDSDMRAAMAFAVLMGMGIMQNMLAVDPLECSEADNARFEKRLVHIFQAALEPLDD